MKLAILGGGGFRVPLVYGALLADHAPGRVTEVRLYDTDTSRMQAIANVLACQASGVADAPSVTFTSDFDEAVRGVDFVFSAIRVGGMAGRLCDERIGLSHDVIGQETVGFGGLSYALRTLPVVRRFAERIRAVAPDAWVINFTNPAGIVTESLRSVLGERVIGICDSPVGLVRRIQHALGLQDAPVEIDYAGLNHLGWLRALRIDGRDALPDFLANDALVSETEEGRLFGADWLRTLGAVPNEYLHYYYFRREVKHADQRAAQTRGGYLVGQQAAFYAAAADDRAGALAAWEATRHDREVSYMATNRESAGIGERDEADLVSGGYERVAIALMRAIANDEGATLILNVRNAGTLAALDDDAVVEVPCIVDANGPKPLAGAGLPDFGVGLVSQVKTVERAVIEAATSGSKRHAHKAIALHPLVDSIAVARSLLDDAIGSFHELSYLR